MVTKQKHKTIESYRNPKFKQKSIFVDNYFRYTFDQPQANTALYQNQNTNKRYWQVA